MGDLVIKSRVDVRCMANVKSIDDVTTVYLQQMQGIGLSIDMNELLYYYMAHSMACVSWREF